MISANDHIIRRQFVVVKLPGKANTLALQQRLEWLLEEELPKRLSPVFDRLAGPEVLVDIDHLDIDLGVLPLEGTDEVWLEQALKAYSKALNQQLGSLDNKPRPDVSEGLKLITYWLRHGYLPWWGELDTFQRVISQVILRQAKEILLLLKDGITRKRWIQYIDDEQQQALTVRLDLQLPVNLLEWGNSFPKRQKMMARYWYWESIWRQHLDYSYLSKVLFIKRLKEHLIALQQQLLTNNRPDEKLFSWALASEHEQDQFLKEKGSELHIKRQNLTIIGSKAAVETSPDGIYVPLAGIVLIHPFIEAFFNQLGLLKKEEFKDEVSRSRAVYLLYYLATGQQHAQEPELPLLKLLCGLKPETLIEPLFEKLTAKELKESEQMLQAAIDHWPALEGTTPEELRTTFMLREGKLIRANLGWQLIVEQQSFDVVFQYLPWGLSPIQFPWMEELLWVDWA